MHPTPHHAASHGTCVGARVMPSVMRFIGVSHKAVSQREADWGFRKMHDKPRLEGRLRCGWCGDEIADDTELFGIGAKARPDIDITEMEGEVIDIFLARRDRNVQALVVTKDSPAKKQGKDLLFVACGESCAEALRQGVGAELELAS